MWYGPGRESGSYITGFEPVQRIGVYLDRENEDKIRNRNVQTSASRLRNLTGYGTQFYAGASAPPWIERIGMARGDSGGSEWGVSRSARTDRSHKKWRCRNRSFVLRSNNMRVCHL